ncbi:MAG: purine-nucleoside phosphorylase [Ruminiclostridium sp.]|nr:purine-nucleoside phosphorylase [Ruminiclostridium sp.]
MTPQEKLAKCYESFRNKIDFVPEVAIILGSGLGALADEIDIKAVLDYKDIEGFPQSTVPGHKGRFVFGFMDGVPVVIMQGRVHYYEGYPMQDVVLPTRLMKLMGAKVLFVTNASGACNADFSAGDFMLITDQIANFVPSPLIGANFDELGTRFPDMHEIYDKDLRDIVAKTAKDLDIKLQQGVYIQLTGPNFESPSEVRMCRMLGADAVGMSTACETIAANHAGMKIVGISCVCNLGCGLTDNPLTHEEVMEASNKAAPLFKKLIRTSVVNIYSYLEESKN